MTYYPYNPYFFLGAGKAKSLPKLLNKVEILDFSLILCIISIFSVEVLKTCWTLFFFFFYKLFYFIYFWLRWVFIAARGLSLVVASGGYSSLRCAGFSLQWLLLFGAWALGTQAQ